MARYYITWENQSISSRHLVIIGVDIPEVEVNYQTERFHFFLNSVFNQGILMHYI